MQIARSRMLVSLIASVVAVAITMVAGSCASFGGAAETMADQDSGAYEKMAAEPMPALEGALPPESPAGAARSGLVMDDTVLVSETEPANTAPAERLRVFSANLELIVASVEQSRARIIAIAESTGGYVESSRADFLVVRVPAERFDSALGAIEAEGDVRSRTVNAADVTDQYFDLGRRLEIAEASRDRLLELLERTEDADERVAILRDIRRLTEEIEQLRSSLESLSQLVSYSRISVQLIPRIQVSQVSQSQIPFPWIAHLDPLQDSTREAAADIPIDVPDSFAVFTEGKQVRAEAADGTVIRVGAVVNEPDGDERFWQSALEYHLGAFYRSADPVSAGPYRGVLFGSKDTRPFSYLVLVHRRDEELLVTEVFFPDTASREDRLGTILEAVAGGIE